METDDSGTYVCTVTAGAFMVEDSLYLEVSSDGGGQPSTVSVSPKYQEVEVGERAAFQCEDAMGGDVRWSRGGDWPLSPRAQARGPMMEFNGVQVEDEGEYVCQGPGGLARAQLYVQEVQAWPGAGGGGQQWPPTQERYPAPAAPAPCPSPSVVIEPSEQVVAQGGDASLVCRSSPPGQAQWMKVGEDLTSPQLTVAEEQVTVRGAMVSDRGMYVCTVTTSCGTSGRASSILEVEPREPPLVELYPGPQQTVTRGESVLFQCRYLAGIPSPTISWSREDGQPLSPNAELLPGGVLRINTVTAREAGQYRCVATNPAGTVQALASLGVQEQPGIRLQPSGAVTLSEGSPLTVVCTVTSGDPPPRLSWKRLGVESGAGRPVGDGSPTLSIPRVTKEDEGTYSCVASNSAGEAEERLQVMVTRESPAWPEEPARRRPGEQERGVHEVHTRIGGNVELNCLTGGETPPGSRAVWTRSSQSRPFSRRHNQQDGLLTIQGVKSSDHGLYRCQLLSSEGTVLYELKANLIVKGKIGLEGRSPSRAGQGQARSR